jgi:hypothetical protein
MIFFKRFYMIFDLLVFFLEELSNIFFFPNFIDWVKLAVCLIFLKHVVSLESLLLAKKF